MWKDHNLWKRHFFCKTIRTKNAFFTTRYSNVTPGWLYGITYVFQDYMPHMSTDRLLPRCMSPRPACPSKALIAVASWRTRRRFDRPTGSTVPKGSVVPDDHGSAGLLVLSTGKDVVPLGRANSGAGCEALCLLCGSSNFFGLSLLIGKPTKETEEYRAMMFNGFCLRQRQHFLIKEFSRRFQLKSFQLKPSNKLQLETKSAFRLQFAT